MRLALVCFYCLCVFVYVLYFIATMSFAGYFLPVLFCMLSMLISDSRFDLVWFRLSCDHGWIRSGSVNVRKQQTTTTTTRCQFNNSCDSGQFRRHEIFHHARHRCRALSLSRWGTVKSRVIIFKHWQMVRKRNKGKFRLQHGPMTWQENVRTSE